MTFSERFTAFPGPIRLSRTPYLVEILDQLMNPHVEKITLCFGAQCAKTTALMLMFAYILDQEPGPLLWVFPNDDLARSFSENRLQPMIRDCPILSRHIIGDRHKFKINEMYFDRMTAALVGSNSFANLASRPIRWLIRDEIDKFPGAKDKEAGAVDLSEVRTRTFQNRKIIDASTPTTEDGEIWKAKEAGDEREYFVDCPHCSTPQLLHEDNLEFGHCKVDGKWLLDKVELEATYHCPECHKVITDNDKRKMILNGKWVPRKQNTLHRSYHLPSINALWKSTSLGRCAREKVEASHDQSKLQMWINSSRAEPWANREDQADEAAILSHRLVTVEPGTCPQTPIEIVITADVQKVECWYVVRAWCENEVSYLLRYGMVQHIDDLIKVATGFSYNCNGEMRWADFGYIDSSDGRRNKEIVDWATKHRWTPWKGQSGQQFKSIVKEANGLFEFNTDVLKGWLQTKYKLKADDPGAWHLHRDTEYDYARHLTSEVLVEERNRTTGRKKKYWKQLGSRQNEWLDCEVAQLAVATHKGYRMMRTPERKPATPKQYAEFTRPDGRGYWDR